MKTIKLELTPRQLLLIHKKLSNTPYSKAFKEFKGEESISTPLYEAVNKIPNLKELKEEYKVISQRILKEEEKSREEARNLKEQEKLLNKKDIKKKVEKKLEKERYGSTPSVIFYD